MGLVFAKVEDSRVHFLLLNGRLKVWQAKIDPGKA